MFVGESPPSGGTFFYAANSNLYTTEEAFGAAIEQVTTIAIAGFGPRRKLRTGHLAGHGVAHTPRRFARTGARVARCA
jgi:hypothetical protein